MNLQTGPSANGNRRGIRRGLKWIGIVAGIFLLLAVAVGICNALIADGQWTFGWKNYRYDDSGYQIGEGTVPYDTITCIEVDWMDGIVQIVSCEDRYISLTEQFDTVLSDAKRVHWQVTADGTVLSVKYCSSSWILGGGDDKNITLRIPSALFAQLEQITVVSDSADVYLKNTSANALTVSTEHGSVRVVDCDFAVLRWTAGQGDLSYESERCPSDVQLNWKNGNVSLALPSEASFTLFWNGELVSDLPLASEDSRYRCGDGSAQWYANCQKHGSIFLSLYRAGS